MEETTEFYCHDCGGYIRVKLDKSLNGNHVVVCPKCGHEHCRVIENGKITSDRWDSRNPTYNYAASSSTYSATSMYTTSTSSDYRFTDLWTCTSA